MVAKQLNIFLRERWYCQDCTVKKQKKLWFITLNKKFCYRKDGTSQISHLTATNNANSFSCNRGALQSQASCKLTRLQNILKPRYTSDKNMI